jgi:hypothetical protein
VQYHGSTNANEWASEVVGGNPGQSPAGAVFRSLPAKPNGRVFVAGHRRGENAFLMRKLDVRLDTGGDLAVDRLKWT